MSLRLSPFAVFGRPRDAADAQSGRRKTQLVLADQVVVSGANFATGMVLARVLGPEGYGQYTLVFNAILFMLGIQVSLIDSPMMVLGAAHSVERQRTYFPAVIAGQLVYALLAAVVVLAAMPLFDHFAPQWGFGSVALSMVIAMVFFLCQDFYRRYAFVRNRTEVALLSDLACHGLKFLLLVGFGLWLGLSAVSALWIIAAASVAGMLAALGLRGQGILTALSAQSIRRVAGEHWDFGKWLLAESMASLCASQLVIYITGRIISLSAVGAMAAALHIVGATNVLLLALENLVPSRAAQTYASRGHVALNAYLRRISVLGGAGTVAIVAVAVIGAELWLRLLYGQAYAGNANLVAWWGLYYLIGFAQRPFSIGLRVLGNTRGIFYGTLGGATIALTLSYPLTRAFGVNGAMAALCLVQATIAVIQALSYRAASRSATA